MKTGQISEAEAEYGDHVYPEGKNGRKYIQDTEGEYYLVILNKFPAYEEEDKAEESDHGRYADDASQDAAVSSGYYKKI